MDKTFENVLLGYFGRVDSREYEDTAITHLWRTAEQVSKSVPFDDKMLEPELYDILLSKAIESVGEHTNFTFEDERNLLYREQLAASPIKVHAPKTVFNRWLDKYASIGKELDAIKVIERWGKEPVPTKVRHELLVRYLCRIGNI